MALSILVYALVALILWFTLIAPYKNLNAAPLPASQSGGSGTSMVCNGGEPDYCARTDRSIAMPQPIPPGKVNVPFVLPEFGVTAVRVTDAFTDPANFAVSYHANAGDYFSQIGPEDAAACNGTGGHRFILQEHSINVLLYTLCDKTMVTTFQADLTSFNAPQQLAVAAMAHVDPAEVFGVIGTNLEYYCSPDVDASSTKCAGKGGTYNVIYNLSSCPNLPWNVDPNVPDPPTTNWNDTIISVPMTDNQNEGGVIFTYNMTTGNCYWFNPATFTYGGTGITPTVSPQGRPFSDILGNAPTVTTTAGGSGTYPAATYDVCVTYSGDFMIWGVGETPCSAITKITLAAVGSLNVTPNTTPSAFWNQAEGGGIRYQDFSVYACEPDPCTPTLQDYYQFGVGNGTTTSFSATISATAYPSLAPATDKLVGSGPWNFTNGDPWGIWGASGSFQGFLYYFFSSISGTPSGNTYPLNFATAPPNGHAVWMRWDGATNPQSAASQTTMTLNTLVTNGPAAPTAGTSAAGGGFGIHTSAINQGGTRVFWESQGTLGLNNAEFENYLNGNVVTCNLDQGCEGHMAFGFTQGVGVANSSNFGNYPFTGHLNYTSWGLDTPTTFTEFLQGPPYGPQNVSIGTSHASWNNDLNGADNEPFFVGTSSSGASLEPLAPIDLENSMMSPASGTIYRFGHTRATGNTYVGGNTSGDFFYLTFGSVSPDGKFAMMSGDWHGELGCSGCSQWQSSHSYGVNGGFTDPNGNLEITFSACTSGSGPNPPAFPTGPFGATMAGDGTCTWHLLSVYGMPNYGFQPWNAGAAYVGGGYLLDPAFNWEYESVPFCVSGAAQPTWPVSAGTVQDGTCLWHFSGASGFTSAFGPLSDRLDVWMLRLK
ncbi:MAG: hypothetical protein KGN01_06995 [Patescibacteria group bacterium]|nr:hypothetical protein [Patescibacteria group bacterium]